MNTEINKWEEIVYDFFKAGLQFSKHMDIDGYDDINDAKIVPTKETIQYLQKKVEGTVIKRYEVGVEFEKEVNLRRTLMRSELDRFQYAIGLQYKFQVFIDRLPIIQEVLVSIYLKGMDQGEKWEMDAPFYVVSEYCRLLECVKKVISDSVETSKKIIQAVEALSKGPQVGEKLKWLCKPAVSGYILQQLFDNGYLEYPVRNGEMNVEQTGNLCMSHFDFGSDKDGYIKKLLAGVNSISEMKRGKLKLPHANDMK